jgi:hypothetical protein
MGPSREIKSVPIILLNCSRKRFRFLTAKQMQPGTVIERCEGSSPSSPPKFYVGNGEMVDATVSKNRNLLKLGLISANQNTL